VDQICGATGKQQIPRGNDRKKSKGNGKYQCSDLSIAHDKKKA